MIRSNHHLAGVTLAVMLALSACLSPGFGSEKSPSFRDEVLPVLSGHCFECHGFDPGTRFPKDEPLRLDEFAAAISARSDGKQAIVPGNPGASLIIQRVRSTDPDMVMPPPQAHKPLSKNQIDILERWIAAGARYERHWAFEAPPAIVPVPATEKSDWPQNPIDSFVLARLQKEQLAPSPPAPPERWLRRVTYDLTGLPPTSGEMDAFRADTSPGARERVVDRLLASPRFGEHMATPWLDVARYADSFGYQADVDTHAWPYRDWVVRAFNENLPFDDFIIHQLAGDLLPGATREQKIATAYNRIHRKTNEGGSVPEEFRQDGISDRVHTIGTAFMALTMECSRCHDHKYDPISMKDYYSMAAFFNSIDEFGIMGFETGVLPQPTLPLPTPEQEARLAELEKDIAIRVAGLAAAIAASEDAFQSWLASEKSFPDSDLAGHFDFDTQPEGNQPKANPGPNRIVPGKSGNGVLANGDDAISLPDFGIRHADQAMSVSLWLKPAENHPRAVVFANSSSADVPYSGYELLLENGRLSWTLAREFPGSAASVATTASIPVGEWTHVTVTSDGSRRASGLKVYLNGRMAETTTLADTLTRDYTIGSGLHFAARSRDFGLRDGVIDDIRVHTRAITPVEVAAIHAGKSVGEMHASSEQLRDYHISAIDPKTRDAAGQLTAARAAYRNAQNKVREIVTMRESAQPVPAYILSRGDYTSPAERVERETPSWLPPFPENEPRNRLGFARWLVSPDHPLTARVTVNRLWQQLFGRGLVETSDNFGLQGARPSHPDLLDWLARDFIRSGWDQKRMIRQIVLSATYAQDSKASPALRERDPDNSLLARGPARRLSAEQLRDSALALSGLLSETIGGPPAKPYQPPGSMWKTLNNFLPEYKADQGEGLYRRSLYTFWRRTTTPPNMMAFDAGTRDVCSTGRQATNTPLQALVLLNDVQFIEAARKLGERTLQTGGSDDETRAARAWREVVGKNPSADQLAILLEIIRQQRAFYQAKPDEASALLKSGASPADPSLDPVEAATFTILAQALLNLDAHITLR